MVVVPVAVAAHAVGRRCETFADWDKFAPGGEEGDEAAIGVARDALGGAESGPLGCLVGRGHFQSPLGTWTGRISIEP